jgi:hypothetical protein
MAKSSSQGSGDRNDTPTLENCRAVLSSNQDQIRFADAKAAFIFAINTLMFGFVSFMLTAFKKALGDRPIPVQTWVGLLGLVVFGGCAIAAVWWLIRTVMSRFGEQAPKTKVYFGHIASVYGKDYGKYTNDVREMSNDDWISDVTTQIVETAGIAAEKHRAVKVAGL